MKIDVRDNQIEPALKALKKLMLKRKRKQAQARKTLRKAMRAPLHDNE